MLAGAISLAVQPPRYRRENNVVYIEGWVKGAPLGQTFAILPQGYRPSQVISCITSATIDDAHDAFNAVRIMIAPNGALSFHAPSLLEKYNVGGASIICFFTIDPLQD